MDDFRDILPDNVRPQHYALTIAYLRIEPPWTYQGQVEIFLQVQQATRTITLNSHELKIHRALITVQGDKPSVHGSTQITHDASLQRCTIHFDKDLEPFADPAVLSICFEGTMNEYMAGFYRSEYDAPNGEPGYMFSTQFEPSEARRAFPCFDEPALKATFDVQLEVPATMTALSNMPVKTRKPARSVDDELKIVTFERSPKMSTYLLSWAIGHFEYIEQTLERRAQALPVRVYTTQGLSEQGRRGLDVACKVIDHFSEMFDIEYPLPKLDLLAVHEMSDDAMENWGLVTFQPTALLYDEETSDPSYLSHLTYIIAHELAHQWFGNITTMEWWDELWLNEGFATWAGWHVCDHLHPEWNVWATFAAEDMRTAFDLDGLISSHPIHVPIPDGREVDSIFDSISYLKSASVIRMLAARLGLACFLKGVSEYLKANAYGNATAVALWEALEKASAQDVTSIMRSWVGEVGFPILIVSEVAPHQIKVRQDRFLFAGETSPDESTTKWPVPIQVPTFEGERRIYLTDRETVISNIETKGFYRLNAGQMGFYLTQATPETLARLCTNIQEASTEDKVGLLTDVATLAMSGNSTTSTVAVLSVISSLTRTEPDYAVLSIVLFCLDRIQSIFSDHEDIDEALDQFTQDVVGGLAQNLSWKVCSSDGLLKIKLRDLVLSAAGLAGHPWTIEEALRLWDLFRGSRCADSIHPSLRRSVFSIAIRYRGLEAFDVLRDEYARDETPDGGEIIVEAMSEVDRADLAKQCLTFAFEGGMASSDCSDLMMNLAQNSSARETVWTFMRENWSLIDERLGGSSAVMEPLIRRTLQVFTTRERRAEIDAFFSEKNTTGYTRGLTIALECIAINAAYRKRDEDVVRSWLKEKGYI